ncbi:glucans biosynthesis glucosyltransferase MdoH [Bradyrhizobium sp. WSM471]|uniref:glucans biosynthesis glucosyltransferase MdoH n=1 Tax=Bradyrhizobium sp. WSM471 TaxID=319017 RepID=UPI00056A5A77|nr:MULTISPECIES: glucans biosynthesis glucosyltransferase MdoH [Bradyrhizobium]UFW38580.1 glucans biosynthesis glucosyltransferase MdoH [Bradyrhizobium canariense]
MGALTSSPALSPELGIRYLPDETPRPMLPCRLDGTNRAYPARLRTTPAVAARRLFILAGTAAITAAGAVEMYDVLKVGGVTVLEGMVFGLFLVLLAWIAFSFVSSVAGFFVLLRGRPDVLPINSHGPLPGITGRTAMLLPTYNEDQHHLMARLRAMYESVGETGQAPLFDWFLLSDTTDPDIWIAEELAFLELQRNCGSGHLYYRHRSDNTARKSGNIAEWVRRFGGAYDYMIILDADSLMSGETIVRLAGAMEANPQAALIQTLPIVVNARTLISRLQQFSGRLYGPLIAAGNAWWHASEGNYWGHNAIIRVQAFAQEAGLPELRGRKPFGGHILSHDFVEAALMRRAGWGIFMAPDLGGSFEEVPPSLLDFAARDRRWCQGNLQHLAVLPAQGLHWVSRLHLLTGIGSYLTAPLWLLFLLLGILISLQAYFVKPEYFPKGFSLFPTWPAQDPVLAAWVFAATMGLLIVPKLLAYLVLLTRRAERQAFGGGFRVLLAVVAESLLAALIAPSMMIFQSTAVAEILLGRDAGWQVQRRSDGRITRDEVYRKFTVPTLCGLAMAASAYAVSLPLLLWMSPVIIGLVCAIPIGLITSTAPRMARLFATPEDNRAPALLQRARELASLDRIESRAALIELRQNPALLGPHMQSLEAPPRKSGQIDIDLAIARAKIEQSDDFEEAVSSLSAREILAVLKHRHALEQVMRMPRATASADV